MRVSGLQQELVGCATHRAEVIYAGTSATGTDAPTAIASAAAAGRSSAGSWRTSSDNSPDSSSAPASMLSPVVKLPVDPFKAPIMVGPTNPPSAPIELMKAIVPAVAAWL